MKYNPILILADESPSFKGCYTLDVANKVSTIKVNIQTNGTWAGSKLKQITLCRLYWDVLSSALHWHTIGTTRKTDSANFMVGF